MRLRAAGILLVALGAVGGFVIAFGDWGVGYCGSLTPDSPPAGALRSDLCRGTSGNLMGGVVLACCLVAAAAPLLGLYWARRRNETWPLAVATALGWLPIATIAILAEALPRG